MRPWEFAGFHSARNDRQHETLMLSTARPDRDTRRPESALGVIDRAVKGGRQRRSPPQELLWCAIS